jgi:hypothetical protein
LNGKVLVASLAWVEQNRNYRAFLADESLPLDSGRYLRLDRPFPLWGHTPRCTATSPEETLFFIERHDLMGRGIGYVDASILASALLVQANLWSRDKRLMALATELGCAYSAESSE